MFFSLRNSFPLFSITRSSSFSVIHVSVNIKNNAEKDTTLVLFFLSKSSGGHVKTLSCIWVVIPVDWVILHWYACGANGRSLARCTVTWLPNFLGWVDYHISSAIKGWSTCCIILLGEQMLPAIWPQKVQQGQRRSFQIVLSLKLNQT